MANIFYTGPGGNDANSGLSWGSRKETITGLMNLFPRSGDRLYVGPGVYRETVTLNGKAEEHAWTSGTVSVTHNSKIVTGAGTTWAGNGLRAGDTLFIGFLEHQHDGVGTAGVNYSSATAAFEANLVGFCINIRGEGSYKVATVTPPNAITLTDVNGVGWPAAAGGQVFYVPSNEGSYEIESVESDTQLTLVRPWSGPTYTALEYEMWRGIYLIGDETGAHTDGVGGVCRITGSDSDTAVNRALGIDTENQLYWTIRGFQIDTVSSKGIDVDDSSFMTFEDIRILNPGDYHIAILHVGDRITVRRCAFFGGDPAIGIDMNDVLMRWDEVNHFENIYAACYYPFYIQRFANTTIKNCTNGMNANVLLQTANIDLGGCVFIHDCEIQYCNSRALITAANGQIIADWISFWDNNPIGGPNIFIGTLGANCEEDTYLYLPDIPRLVDNYRYPVRFYPPSQWWGVAFQGLYAANEDIYGILKPTTDTKLNWGPQQTHYIERDTATVYGGEEASMEHIDARTTQWRIASSGDPVTVTVWVRRETNYAGTLPKLVVHQAGNTDVEVIATGAVDAWEQLSVSYTPNAQPPIIWASVVTDNTAGGALIATYWQHLGDALT